MRRKPGKRMVSKEEYVKIQFKRVTLLILGACLVFVSCYGIHAIHYFWTMLFVQQTLLNAPDGLGAVVATFLILGSIVGGGTLLAAIAIWGLRTLNKAKWLNPGVPLTRANSVNLPASDSLVRASHEPLQAQKKVLLRAAIETTQGHEEQLLRASAGSQE